MKLDSTSIGQNVTSATEYNKLYYALNAQIIDNLNNQKIKRNSGGTTGFIPFGIEFTLDGISGIKIYNKLTIDTSFLPNGYPTTLDFIVTGVSHTIKDGDWETNVKVTLIPKFETVEVNDVSQPFTAAPEEKIHTAPSITPTTVTSSPTNTSATEGPANGNYISPARKADAVGDFIDVSKTINNSTLKKLAGVNEGLFPIKLYTKPGDSSGTLYSKVVQFNGARNVYEANPDFDAKNIVSWTYKGNSGFSKSARVNKIWVPTLTQMAQTLDSKGMWNSNHIVSWDAGILRRDVTPSGVVYGQISAHAFGMAIDINAGQYPLGASGKTNWNRDIAANVPTALVHDVINKNFVLTQGGDQKVFWLYPNDTHHFSVYVKV